MSLSALCKVCLYYNPRDKTCGRSVVAVSNGQIHHNYAKAVRLDKTQCGPQGAWYAEMKEKTPVEELFESFDI
jgi:hypothetical protein